jgi:co-chaperonin GroES (HSP10)
MAEITPAPGYVLVQLGDYYEGVKLPEAKFDTKTEGTVIAVNPGKEQPWARMLNGHKVYWGEYQEGKRVHFEGKQQAFIKIDDIQGFDR